MDVIEKRNLLFDHHASSSHPRPSGEDRTQHQQEPKCQYLSIGLEVDFGAHHWMVHNFLEKYKMYYHLKGDTRLSSRLVNAHQVIRIARIVLNLNVMGP